MLCCEDCAQTQIAYNSCRNRHCPKCQGSAARRWLQDRQADLLPVDYYHLVFTLPAPISDIAYHNKAVAYNLLFKATAETLLTIAADPKDFTNYLAPLRKIDWVVYAKRPFAGPEAVLAYLSRYTHRVAISNSRPIAKNKKCPNKWPPERIRTTAHPPANLPNQDA